MPSSREQTFVTVKHVGGLSERLLWRKNREISSLSHARFATEVDPLEEQRVLPRER